MALKRGGSLGWVDLIQADLIHDLIQHKKSGFFFTFVDFFDKEARGRGRGAQERGLADD